jgi:reverse gyrase
MSATDVEELVEWRDHIETRVSRLEATSDQHVEKISDHGGLLVSMDEDLSKIQVEFRAQRGMLQALHDTQSEHVTVLRKLETGQEELRRGQAKVLAGVQTIIGLFDRGIDGGNQSGG